VLLLSRGADLLAVMKGYGTVDRNALELYGTSPAANLSADQKEQGRAALLAAFATRKDQKIAAMQTTIAAQDGPVRATTSLLLSDDFADLVFVAAGGERIPAHKCLLSASSEHMAALLRGPWAENADGRESVVQVEQSGVAVHAMLRFVYTGQVDGAALAADLGGVLDLASQHGLEGLRAACEQHGVAGLSVGTVVPLAVAAHLYELPALKAACVELIKANGADDHILPEHETGRPGDRHWRGR
jgi:speckle-type POZ protein